MLNKNESNERTNEFGQYEYKVQEKVTTKKIEHDLQKVHKRNIIMHLALFPFLAFIDGVYIWLILAFLEDGKNIPIFVMIAGAAGLLLTAALIFDFVHSIYMLFSGYKKFYIAIDHFRGIKTVRRRRRRRTVIDYYLMFNKYGKVQFFPETEYYTWSENYRMWGKGIAQSVHIGDRFFLIMRGKKIVYFYNDRMFDLSETLKKARVIGETPQPTLNGESVDNGNDQNGDSGEERIFH